MATSVRTFNADLYREHLDEISFLYDQRSAYLRDPEVNWPDLRSWDERLEAHLDALELGGAIADETCRRSLEGGDAGTVYAVLSVWCRQDRAEALAALSAFDLGDEAIARAATLALCQSAPSAWRTALRDALHSSTPPLTSVLASVTGYRRLGHEAILRGKLSEPSPNGRAEIAWALGRVGTAESVAALWSLFQSENERVRESAALALMRLGDDRPLQLAYDSAMDHPWARRLLAIGGHADAAQTLIGVLDAGRGDVDTVLALGLLGYLPAVTRLLDLLDNEKLSKTAADALNTITGAEAHARVFIPDAFDIDELSDEERAAFERDGTVPTRRGGEPYGTWERSPLRDKSSWRSWLDENKHRFDRHLRWRFGMPYSPAALMASIRTETTPFAVRAASYEELVVRYGLDVPFEVDLSVAQQWRGLEKIAAWVTRQSSAFIPGEWYFAGRRQK